MNNIIIVSVKPDIPIALNLYSQISDAEIWVFDPNFLDDLDAAGMHYGKFIDCIHGIDLVNYSKNAERQTILIEKEIGLELEKLIPETEDCHWQYFNLFHQLFAINSFSTLWDKLLMERQSAKFHILIHDTPAQYYSPSFWPSLLLLERLNALNIDFSAYSYNRSDSTTQLIPTGNNFSADSGRHHAFVHLPTSIYDAKFFEEEINSATSSVLNFQSMHWDVPFSSLRTVSLCASDEALAQLPLATQQSIADTTVTINDILLKTFGTHIRTEAYIVRQANFLAKQYEAQMIFYFSLIKVFSSFPPRKIILSNHDAGLLGPFTSFAKKYNVPIVLLPHAKIFNWSIANSHSNATVLTHPLQGGLVTDLRGKRIVSHSVSYPESQSNSSAPVNSLKTVGVVLNSFSGDGYVLLDTAEYSQGLKKILSWCKKHDIQCRPRVKPAGKCMSWLIDAIGFDRSELIMNAQSVIADFSQDCDICLMYDCPTSGAIEMLRNSVPTINTIFRALCPQEAAIVNTQIVPRETIEETLQRLEFYRTNPNELFIFRNKQFAQYVASFGESLPLRMFI